MRIASPSFRPGTVRQLVTAILLLSFIGYCALPARSGASDLAPQPNPLQPNSPQIKETISSGGVQACTTCPAPTQQVVYAPLIGLPEASRSEIVLNCRSPQPMDVTPTFYTAEGAPVTGQVIRLQPAEMRFVDVLSLIPEEHRYQQRWGGMSLSYTGRFMEAWAQLTLHGVGGRNSVDVLFAVVNAPRSNVREAVWRMPRNGAALIALGNYSDSTARATLTFSDGERREVNIAPYATEIVLRRANELRGLLRSSGESESVSINSNGQLGRLITAGLVTSADGGFTSSIRFYDTQNVAQPNLYATNFRLKDSETHLLLRNATADAVTARPRFLPASGETGGAVELPAVTVPANEIVEVNLKPLMSAARRRRDLDSVGVQVINSGAQGSLIGAVYSTNNTTGITYDIPLRDSGMARNSAGGYPVRLDGDYTTVLSITNASDKPSKFTVQINYEGGKYALYPQGVAAGATAVFDVRKMRDEQTPDSTGGTLPPALTVGQIRWSINGDSSTRLIGRSEVVSLSGGVSSSYSCGVCCPNNVFDGRVVPGTSQVFAEDWTRFQATQRDQDCYGNVFQEYPVNAFWTSGDYSVADVSWDGLATGMDGGDTLVYASWTATRWAENLSSFCEDSQVEMNEAADMAVRPRISSLSPTRGPVGNTISVTITGSGFRPGATTVNAGSGISVSVGAVSNTQISASFTIAANAEGGDRGVTVTSGGQPSNSMNFFVQVPARLTVLSVAVLPTGTSGAYGCTPDFDYGIKVGIRYQVLDQGSQPQPIRLAGMEPQEQAVNFYINGQRRADLDTPFWGDIGPAEGYPGTSQFTDSNGQFLDEPYGSCFDGPVVISFDQPMSILYGNQRYSLRTNSITVSSSSQGHGSITNGSDISASR